MSVTAGNGRNTLPPSALHGDIHPARPTTFASTLDMSNKLSNSLNKMEALVLSTTSRTTADGDDASVVKKFSPAWEYMGGQRHKQGRDAWGRGARPFRRILALAYVHPRSPVSDDGKKLHAGSTSSPRREPRAP